MPKPSTGESKDAFLSRCMSSAEAQRTAVAVDHRYAMCNGIWEQHQKSIELGEEFNEQEATKAASAAYKNKMRGKT